jgi:hypothetical protein
MAYSNIKDPSAYFQTALWTGSNSQQAITNDGNSDLKPDWLWIKQKNGTENHMLVDSTRGVTKYLLSDSTTGEQTVTSRVETLDTDGFTVNGSSNPVNASGGTYVGWQWVANGGTTSTNTAGTINTTIQTNTTAGFSICTHDGNGTSGATFGHGLGVKPDFIMAKRRDGVTNWRCYHPYLGATKTILLNTSDAAFDSSDSWNNTEPTSTLLSVGSGSRTNATGSPIMFYIFTSKQGYSKFGSYKGNGNANGSFVYTGFKPAFVITKSTSTGSWSLYDHKRSGYNPIDVWLRSNGTDAESTSAISGDDIDLLSTGFKLRNSDNTINANGQAYIYLAWAENPFVAGGVPTTAR